MSVHLQLRGQPGVHQRLTDLTQTYFEALAQSPAAACRPSPLPGPQQTRPPRAHRVRAGSDGRGALREAGTMV